jgi:septal ring-binding cell division protein DamX
VTAVETPPPAPAEETRRCPRCGADLTPQQEWCLNCGADVSSTIAPPPSWRGPVALVGVLLAIAAAALILALVELAGDAEQVAEQPAATATPAAPTPAPTVAPESTTIPPATDDGSGGTTPEIADWPAGKDAWTVVLEASETRQAAEARANELAQQGVPVGILDSDDYGSLEPGRFVVFSGQYDSQRAAEQAQKDLSGQVEGAYVRHVAPSAAGSASPSPSPSSTVSPTPTL